MLRMPRFLKPRWRKSSKITATPLANRNADDSSSTNDGPSGLIKTHSQEKRRTDYIGLVGYHDHGFVIARPTNPYAPWLGERTRNLHQRLGGMANITDGLRRALDLLSVTPSGIQRAVWLLSNSAPNREARALFPIVHACRDARIAIHTTGLGDDCDDELLHEIAQTSGTGNFLRVRNPHDLSRVLYDSEKDKHATQAYSTTTIVVIDCSHGMQDQWGSRRKIEHAEEALLDLLYYKKRHGA